VRATYLSEKSLGSVDAKLAALRVIATLEQQPREGVEPQERERLPHLLETALTRLEGEELDLWAIILEPGVAPVAMHFQWGLTKVLDGTMITIAFVIKVRSGEYLEWYSNNDVGDFVACSACLRRTARNISLDYSFEHYSNDPDAEVGAFRLAGVSSRYLLQMRGPTSYDPWSPWAPAGDGLVRCLECRTTFDLKSGKEESL